VRADQGVQINVYRSACADQHVQCGYKKRRPQREPPSFTTSRT